MFGIAKNLVVAIALTGLVLSRPALVVRSSGEVGRVGTPAAKAQQLAGLPTIGGIIAAAVTVAVLAIVISEDKNYNRGPALP